MNDNLPAPSGGGSYKRTYTVSEAARLLGVSAETLRRWDRKGIFKPFRTKGGQRRYSLINLEAYKSGERSAKTPLKISQAAEQLGVHPETLRRWERAGTIHAERTNGGQRRYTQDFLRKIKAEENSVVSPGLPPISPTPPVQTVVPSPMEESKIPRSSRLIPVIATICVLLLAVVGWFEMSPLSRERIKRAFVSSGEFPIADVNDVLQYKLSDSQQILGLKTLFPLEAPGLISQTLTVLKDGVLNGARFLGTAFFGQGSDWYVKPTGDASLNSIGASLIEVDNIIVSGKTIEEIANDGGDADTLEGKAGAYYLSWANTTGAPAILSSLDGVANDEGNIDLIAGANILIAADDAANSITLAVAGGSGSGLDADLLDGESGAYYLDLDNEVGTCANCLTGFEIDESTLAGIDADTLDGQDGVYYLDWTNFTGKPNIVSSVDGVINNEGNVDFVAGANIAITPDDLTNTVTFDVIGGSGSGLDGDTLDGQDGSFYLSWANTTGKPTILSSLDGVTNNEGDVDLLEGSNITITSDDTLNTITLDVAGGSGSGLDADTLDGLDSLDFLRSTASDNFETGTLTFDALTTLDVSVATLTLAANQIDESKVLGEIESVGAGSGLIGGGTDGAVTLSHEDTSSQSSADNADGNVIQDLTLDTFGHITALASVDLDTRYYTQAQLDGGQLDSRYYTETETDNLLAVQDALSEMGDVTITLAEAGDYLRYSGTDWVDVGISQVLTDLLTVDGSGSGLDADTLDGQDTGYFLDLDNETGTCADCLTTTEIDESTFTGLNSTNIDDIYLFNTGDTGTGTYSFEDDVSLGLTSADTLTVNALIGSDLIPDTDDQYDLGSPTARWQDLYLGPSSLNIYRTTGANAEYFTIGYESTPTITFSSLADGGGTARNFNFAGGNVGIGTASPNADLDVENTTPEIRLTNSSTSEYTRVNRTAASNLVSWLNRVNQPGVDPYALEFDGNDEVQVPDNATIRLVGGDFTVRAWVYLNSAASSASRMIVEKIGAVYARDWNVGINASRQLTFKHQGDTGGNYASTGTVPLTTWTHVQVSVDQTNDLVYFAIGGTVESQAFTTSFQPESQYDGILRIGKDSGQFPAQENFDGRIDELELSNTVRNTANFTPSSTRLSPDGNTAALWHFDEGTGTDAADSSANGNDGTLSADPNDPAWVTGYVTDAGTTVEATVWSSENGVTAGEGGLQKFGDSDGGTWIQGQTQRFYIGGTEMIRLNASGYLGIGTAAPDSKLHLAGGDIYVAPDSGYTFDNFSNDEDLYVFGNLEVDGTLFTAGQTIAGDLIPAADAQYDLGSATARWQDLYLGPSSLNIYNTIGDDAEYFTIGYDGTPTITFSSLADGLGTARNFNFTGGNVGIGTAAPEGKLHVHSATAGVVTPHSFYDDLVVENAGDAGISILTPDGSYGGLIFGSPSSNTRGWVKYYGTSDLLQFGQNGGDRMWLTASGLQFQQATSVTTTTGDLTIDPAANTVIKGSTSDSTTAVLNVQNSGSGPLLYVRNDGNVGIGTASPGASGVWSTALSISNTGTAQKFVGIDFEGNRTTDGYIGGLNFINFAAASQVATLMVEREGADNTGAFTFSTRNSGGSFTERVRITSDGNVGIGDITPDYLLELYDATATPIFALSDDDIAHGVTTLAQTDVFSLLSSISPTVGGAQLTGLASATGTALLFKGVQSSDPTDTTPAISLVGTKASGTGVQDLLDAETVLQIVNNDNTAALTILGNGYVGIGTNAPDTALHVFNSSAGTVTAPTNLDLTIESGAAGGTGISVLHTDAALGRLIFGTSSDNDYFIMESHRDSASLAYMFISAQGKGLFELATSELVLNYNANDIDFSVMGDTDINLIRTDAGNNRVGIGDSTPDGKLDVEPTGAVTTAAGATALSINNLTTNSTTALTKYGAYITSTGTFDGGVNATNNYGLYVDTVSGADLNYGAYIAGSVGIGTVSPDQRLEVETAVEGNVMRLNDGTETCDLDPDATQVTETCSSDIRLKTNISDASGALEYLSGLPIKEFDMLSSGEHHMGVIAQELLALPEYADLVTQGSDGYYRVRSISPWKIISGIQEVGQKINDLQAQIESSQGIFERLAVTAEAIISTLRVEVAEIADATINNLTVTGKIISPVVEVESLKARSIESEQITTVNLEADTIKANKIEGMEFEQVVNVTNVTNVEQTVVNSPESGVEAVARFIKQVSESIWTTTLEAVTATVGNLTVTGKIISPVVETDTVKAREGWFDRLTTAVEATFNKLIADTAEIVSAFVKDLTVDQLTVTDKTSGQASMSDGKSEVIIMNELVTETSKVFVTFRDSYAPATNYWVSKVTAGESFTVTLDQPADANARLDYWIVN